MGKLLKIKGEDKFTGNEISFVEFYTDHTNPVTFRNNKESYIASTYQTDNMGDASIHVEACRVRNREHIAVAISKRLEKYHKALQMSQDEALARQADIGRFDIGDAMVVMENTCECCGSVEGEIRIDGTLLKKLDLTKHIKKMFFDRQGRQVFEFHDTMKAQDNILKASGAYAPKQENGATTLMSAFASAMKATAEITKARTPSETTPKPDSIEVEYEVED